MIYLAHIQKHKRKASWLLFAHNDREEENDRTFSNEKIDKSRTQLNYDLNYFLRKDFQGLSSYQRLNIRLEELKKGNAIKKIPKEGYKIYEIRQIKKECEEQGKEFIESDYYNYVHKDFRKDANTLISLCVQIPRDENGELVFRTLDEQRKFFEGVCDYLCSTFGKDNLIDLRVHMDETTPHLHGCLVPGFIDENGKATLSCKKVVTLQLLQNLHPTLQLHLEDYLEREDFSILQDKPTKSNVDLKEFKEDLRLQELQEVADNKIIEIKNNYEQRFNYVEEQKDIRIANMQKEFDDKIIQFNSILNKERKRYNDMCLKVKEKEKQIQKMETMNEHSIQSDIMQLGKPNLFGNGKTYTKEELDTIISNAKICDSKIYEYNNHKREIVNLERNYGEQVKTKNNMLEALSKKVEKLKNENIQLQMYKDYVQENDRRGFNEYSKDKVIIDFPVFDEDDFGRINHHSEKKIVSMEEYIRMKKNDKEIKKVLDNGFEL